MKRRQDKNNTQTYSESQKGDMLTIGCALRRCRNGLGKSIAQVSDETNISPERLKCLEEDLFEGFDSDTHATGFIRIYANYLGLDVEKILALYRRTTGFKGEPVEKGIKQLKKKSKENNKKNLSQYLIIIIPIILITILLSYIYIQYQTYQHPPHLEISQPENNTKTQEEKIVIKGETENHTSIEINNESVSTQEDHTFEKELELQENTNVITIKATNTRNPSQETVEIINIDYIEEKEEEEKSLPNITIEIQNTSTWTEIIKDDQLIKSEILSTDYNENFEPEKNITISSSLPQNVQVEVNGEKLPFRRDEDTISCKVEDYELKCD